MKKNIGLLITMTVIVIAIIIGAYIAQSPTVEPIATSGTGEAHESTGGTENIFTQDSVPESELTPSGRTGF